MFKQRALLFALTALALAMALGAVSPAEAGWRWCERDPVFSIAGREINVVVAIPEEHQAAVTGPIVVTLYAPMGVSAYLISTDDGYNGYGEVVSILPTSRLTVTGRGVQARVEVTVPSSRVDMPVDVFVTPAGARTVSVNGKSNTVVPIQFTVQPVS